MDGFGLFILGTAVTVSATVGVAVRLIQLILGATRGQSFSRTVGWRACLGWALGSALVAFSAAAIISIGWFVLPIAVIVCGIVAWRCRALPEGAIGASLGTGVVLSIIGLMNPTPPPGRGVDGTSWLPVAIALVVLAVLALVGQTIVERRKRVLRPQP